MGSELELYEARVSYLQFVEEGVEVHFSYACIHMTKSERRYTGRSWSQEAVLLMQDGEVAEPSPPLPNRIADGYLEVGERRYEFIPLPFERSSPARLHLEFGDGSILDARGQHPMIKLVGEKVFF